ncbi:histidine phosphotransferase ChpT [Albimonas donghaensis]|uniref:Histidine phosphotransferase ChpT n=1 Tax=Albimonas donghaensis TaxID=356660 RepID=A0A1H3AP49_9RHOB|nr:histidine phosphotransferase family protein [Albimonas donghaensis]SDX31472.1 histidine phosphotransferase ChpT [Albimonas donghaensis]
MTDAAPLRPQNVSAALPDPAEFGAMLCSRICHDLISPVGAIGNGVELLQELDRGATEGAELQLIGHSAQMASASLQFLRIAFGAASPGDVIGMSAVQRTARLWFSFQRPELLWVDAGGETTRSCARLLFNFLQIAASSLPRGGEVSVVATRDSAGESLLEVTAAGPVVSPSPEAGAWLAGRATETPAGPRDAHYLAAAAHARAAGTVISLHKDETCLRLTADMPPGV